MTIAKRFAFCCVLVTVLGSVTTFAREYNRAQGLLLRLDTGAKKIVIRTQQGSQLQCTITGETRITGAGDSLRGLPTMTRLTVHYAKEEMEFVATEIEVHGLPF